jgi:hypothetical protein
MTAELLNLPSSNALIASCFETVFDTAEQFFQATE